MSVIQYIVVLASLSFANLTQVYGYGHRENDTIFDRIENKKKSRKKQTINHQRSLVRNPSDRQAEFWNLNNAFESHKADKIYGLHGSDGRKVFSSYRWIVLPVYWNTDTSDHMDMSKIEEMMSLTVQNYDSQSFGRLDMTYEIMPQTVYSSSTPTSLTIARREAKGMIKRLKNYDEGTDYEGIIMVYHPVGGRGDLCCSGGLAFVGGTFLSSSYSSDVGSMYRVTRHEVGHTYGHAHHVHNHYSYRDSRPNPAYVGDGFDFMSGGNKYDRSDFGLYSKWFYNWVSDNSIVPMQPEGKTLECPSCLNSGTFTLKAFDNWSNIPTDNDILGIRIPVAKVYNDYWETDLAYSYWLSYRTGVGGHLIDGLQIHLVWFEFGNYHVKMGAWFDSMNFDAFGFSDDKSDSVVLADSCYHVSPPPYMLDLDFISANAVQPVVCVDSVNEGSDITVSVSFIDPEAPPAQLPEVVEHSVSCSTSSTYTESFDMDSKVPNLIHVKGLGDGGSATLSSFASHQGWDKAFFYDGYPYSPLVYGAYPEYGSMKRLVTDKVLDCNAGENCGNDSGSVTYVALYGEIFIVVAPMTWAAEGDRVVATLSCKAENCMRNEYLANGRCNSCPPHHTADAGATLKSQCQPCPSGSYLSYPYAPECSVGYREISPTDPPTNSPVGAPTKRPTMKPTRKPTRTPTLRPTLKPTLKQTPRPTQRPTPSPINAAPVSSPIRATPAPTPAPVSPPTKSPTVPAGQRPPNCTEDPKAMFLMRKNALNKVITRNCSWLQTNTATQSAQCAKDVKYDNYSSAKYVCFKTCNSCELSGGDGDGGEGGSDDIVDVDDPSATFFKGMKRKNNGQLKMIKKTCGWLSGKNAKQISKICRKSNSKNGVQRAKFVCPNTCEPPEP